MFVKNILLDKKKYIYIHIFSTNCFSCSSDRSKPAAKLSFYINGDRVSGFNKIENRYSFRKKSITLIHKTQPCFLWKIQATSVFLREKCNLGFSEYTRNLGSSEKYTKPQVFWNIRATSVLQKNTRNRSHSKI